MNTKKAKKLFKETELNIATATELLYNAMNFKYKKLEKLLNEIMHILKNEEIKK